MMTEESLEQLRQEPTGENGDSELDAVDRLRKSAERTWTYTPMGHHEPITLTLTRAREFLATPTATGKMPSDRELTHFLQMCKLRKLDPWIKDAFLLGYDTKTGAKFETIVAHQALAVRAELNEAFDGMRSGVIVKRGSEILEREGAFALETDQLVGAWCVVYRKDRSQPHSIKITRSAFDKKRSRWAVDPNGMLVKCAKSAALRDAFPADLGGMYTEDEMPAPRESVSHGLQRGSLKAVPLVAPLEAAIDAIQLAAEQTEVDIPQHAEYILEDLVAAFSTKETIHDCGELEGKMLDDSHLSDGEVTMIKAVCDERLKQIRGARGPRSNSDTTTVEK